MFRSATWRLTLWYVLLATGLCLLFSAVVYHLSTGEIAERLHHQYARFMDSDHDRDTIPLPDADIHRSGQHLLGELVWFNAAVVAGSSVVGYFLARRTLRPIQNAHQAQLRFTAEASHELRTPLAAMRADTEVALMEKTLPSSAKRALEDNLRDIERLERLTNHLLNIARYQNKPTAKPELLDLDEIVQDVIAQLDHVMQEKHLRIRQDIHPAQIMGEPYGVRQLVAIVLDNAIKYSQQQDVITISLELEVKRVLLTIRDSGIGIPDRDLPHVFERFYRSANTKSTTKAMPGYGLGLPLAQEIAKAHNATIALQSHENEGTTVRISFPLAAFQ